MSRLRSDGSTVRWLIPRAWRAGDSDDALQRARLRLAPLAERAVARAAAQCDAVADYRQAWIGHDSTALRELACTLGGYADALEDVAAAMPHRAMQWRTIDEQQRDAARYTRARRAWALVSGLASLARAQERRAGK